MVSQTNSQAPTLSTDEATNSGSPLDKASEQVCCVNSIVLLPTLQCSETLLVPLKPHLCQLRTSMHVGSLQYMTKSS